MRHTVVLFVLVVTFGVVATAANRPDHTTTALRQVQFDARLTEASQDLRAGNFTPCTLSFFEAQLDVLKATEDMLPALPDCIAVNASYRNRSACVALLRLDVNLTATALSVLQLQTIPACSSSAPPSCVSSITQIEVPLNKTVSAGQTAVRECSHRGSFSECESSLLDFLLPFVDYAFMSVIAGRNCGL